MMTKKTPVLENSAVKIGRNVLHTSAFVKGPILNGSNMNEITESGVYNINSNANASTVINIPENTAGMLEVIVSDYYIKQVYTSFQGASMWFRIYYPFSSSWSPWRTIY